MKQRSKTLFVHDVKLKKKYKNKSLANILDKNISIQKLYKYIFKQKIKMLLQRDTVYANIENMKSLGIHLT